MWTFGALSLAAAGVRLVRARSIRERAETQSCHKGVIATPTWFERSNTGQSRPTGQLPGVGTALCGGAGRSPLAGAGTRGGKPIKPDRLALPAYSPFLRGGSPPPICAWRALDSLDGPGKEEPCLLVKANKPPGDGDSASRRGPQPRCLLDRHFALAASRDGWVVHTTGQIQESSWPDHGRRHRFDR